MGVELMALINVSCPAQFQSSSYKLSVLNFFFNNWKYVLEHLLFLQTWLAFYTYVFGFKDKHDSNMWYRHILWR